MVLNTQSRNRGGKESYINLYWYGSRWYDDYLNRWTSPDSIIPDPNNPQDFDRYAFVRNNPVNNIDPTGHYVCQGYDSSWGNLTCYDIINNWLNLLKSEGGDLGKQIVNQFWTTDQEWAVLITFGETPNGVWGNTDTRFGKNITISLGNYGLNSSINDQKLNAIYFGHELYHLAIQKNPQIMGSAYGEKQAYDATWTLLENMGFNPNLIASEALKAIHNADYSDEGLAIVQSIVNASQGLRPARTGAPLLENLFLRVKGGVYTVSSFLAVNLQELYYLTTGCFLNTCGINWNPSTNGWSQTP
jgi:RHS repeat-associated protein